MSCQLSVNQELDFLKKKRKDKKEFKKKYENNNKIKKRLCSVLQ
jgi:hypothetical protein